MTEAEVLAAPIYYMSPYSPGVYTLQTIIAESGTTGVKPGEGGDDLAREYDEEFED